MSEELDKLGPSEPDGDREKISDVEAHKLHSRFSEADEKRDKIAETDEADVEAHKLHSRFSEADEKRDKIAETDEADVEGHMLGAKHSSGKNQA